MPHFSSHPTNRPRQYHEALPPPHPRLLWRGHDLWVRKGKLKVEGAPVSLVELCHVLALLARSLRPFMYARAFASSGLFYP